MNGPSTKIAYCNEDVKFSQKEKRRFTIFFLDYNFWFFFCYVDPIPGLGDGERGRRGVLQRDRLRAGALQRRRFQPLYAVAGRHNATERAGHQGMTDGSHFTR